MVYEKVVGKGYNIAFSTWLGENHWTSKFDKTTRRDLFWVAENRSSIEKWRKASAGD
jgi:hypothetical protein